MKTLPDDILRHLLPFLTDEDQMRMLCCSLNYCRMRKVVRKITLNEERLNRCYADEGYLSKLLSLIDDPGTQLVITSLSKGHDIQKFPFKKVFWLELLDLSLISRLFSVNNELKVKTLDISSDFTNSNQEQIENLVKMCELGLIENLTLEGHEFSQWPYFPRIKSLEIFVSQNISLPGLYSSHLQKLSLYHCSNIDVSCLDHIPDLLVKKCHSIQGISSLQNNRRIEMNCNELDDVSSSFSNSEVIFLRCLRGWHLRIDLSIWKKVKTLSLHCHKDDPLSFIGINLPSTVKRCSIGGLFVDMLNWMPFTHQLSEFTLLDSDISSLQGLALDTIPVVKLAFLPNLTSLEGLGGRNQTVFVNNCYCLTNVSAVRSVDTVTIMNCKRFEDIGQLNEVKVLAAYFYKHVKNLHSLGEATKMLIISASHLPSSAYLPLSKIPNLTLQNPDYIVLKAFISSGGQFHNDVITIYYYLLSPKDIEPARSFYQTYLSSQYHYFESTKTKPEYIRLLKKRNELRN